MLSSDVFSYDKHNLRLNTIKAGSPAATDMLIFGGYSVALFDHTEDELKSYLCSDCGGVLRNPVKTPCGQRVCHHCIVFNKIKPGEAFICHYCKKASQSDSLICAYTLDFCRFDKDCKKEVNNLKTLRCPLFPKDNVCQFQRSTEQLQDHIEKSHSTFEQRKYQWTWRTTSSCLANKPNADEKLSPMWKQLLKKSFPAVEEDSLYHIYDLLERDQIKLKYPLLLTMNTKAASQFLSFRFQAYLSKHKTSLLASCDLEIIKEFEQHYSIETEAYYRGLIDKKGLTVTDAQSKAYRVGIAEGNNNDELVKTTNCKLGLPAFSIETVNHRNTLYGFGLYTAQNYGSCKDYLTETYNQDRHCIALEIVLKDNTSCINIDHPKIHKDHHDSFVKNNVFIDNALILANQRQYILIKNSNHIAKIKAFDLKMTTKAFIYFSREEIKQHGLVKKCKRTLPPSLRGETAKCPVISHPDEEQKITTIFAYAFELDKQTAQNRNLKYHEEVKFYIEGDSINGTKEFIRVKPHIAFNSTKPLTTPDNTRRHPFANLEDTDPVFYVQYHKPRTPLCTASASSASSASGSTTEE